MVDTNRPNGSGGTGTPPGRDSSSHVGRTIAAWIAVLSGIATIVVAGFGDNLLCRPGHEAWFCGGDASTAPPTPSLAPTARPSDPTGVEPGGNNGADNKTGGGTARGTGGKGSAAWQGRILLPNNAALELDSVPAQPVNGAWTGADLNYDNREALGMFLYAGPALAEWSGPGLPDAAGCYQTLTTSQVAKVDPTPGQILCVGTTDNRIARLQVVDAQYQGVRFDAIVWNGG